MNFKKQRTAVLLCLLAGPAYAAPVFAQQVQAVLSSRGGAYMEAFSAFQAAYGREVKLFDISEETLKPGPETGTLVTFGGKAAALAVDGDPRDGQAHQAQCGGAGQHLEHHRIVQPVALDVMGHGAVGQCYGESI